MEVKHRDSQDNDEAKEDDGHQGSGMEKTIITKVFLEELRRMSNADQTPEDATRGNDAYIDKKLAQFNCDTVAGNERMLEDIRLQLKGDAILHLAIYSRDRENAKQLRTSLGRGSQSSNTS